MASASPAAATWAVVYGKHTSAFVNDAVLVISNTRSGRNRNPLGGAIVPALLVAFTVPPPLTVVSVKSTVPPDV